MRTFLPYLLLLFFCIISAPTFGQTAEAETEAEAESEVESAAGHERGLAAAAVAAATAASGSFCATASLTSASVAGIGNELSGICTEMTTSNTFDGEMQPDSNYINDEQAGEVEAEIEVETEAEAEAEVAPGAASAGGGSSVSIGVARTDAARPLRESLALSQDAASSTGTHMSDVFVDLPPDSETPDFAPIQLDASLTGGSSDDVSNEDKNKANVEEEAETEAETEAEAETGPGVAAASASGGAGAGATGSSAAAESKASAATSVITHDVTEVGPSEFDDLYAKQAQADALERGIAVDENGAEKQTGDTEAEVEIEVEVEAEVNNQSAAVAAITSGATGSAGNNAYSAVAVTTTASTSVTDDQGIQTRNNDERAQTLNKHYDESGSTQTEAEADAEVECEASANDRTNAATAETTSRGFGNLVSEAHTRLTTHNSVQLNPRDVANFTEVFTVGDQQPTTYPGTQADVEVEAEAEAEAEVGFHSAAAGAGAGAGWARDLSRTGSGSSSSSSTSTSVDGGQENLQNDADESFPSITNYDNGVFAPVQTAGVEAEAEAEVGLFSGAASASAAATGYEGILAVAEVKTSPYAAASAAASGQKVSIYTVIPTGDQAGYVRAGAKAADSEGRGVSVAAAVAGVPTDDGIDNEMEAENDDELFEASVEVNVKTDPADAFANITVDQINQEPGDTIVKDSTSTMAELEAESEAEAEAGYGTAAAAASAAAAGPYAVTDTKTSTSTKDYYQAIESSALPQKTGSIELLNSSLEDDEISLNWEAPGDQTYVVEYYDGNAFSEIGRVRGANPEIQDNFTFTARGVLNQLDEHEFRIRAVQQPSLEVSTTLVRPRTGLAWISPPYPNPVRDMTEVVVKFERNQRVTASILDSATGRELKVIYDGQVRADQPLKLNWRPAGKVANGTYLLSINGEHAREMKKIVVLR